jgi:hypothetical protein
VQTTLEGHNFRTTKMVRKQVEYLDQQKKDSVRFDLDTANTLQHLTRQTVLEKESSPGVQRYRLERSGSLRKDDTKASSTMGHKTCKWVLLRWKNGSSNWSTNSDQCPRCEEIETSEHVWVCKNHETDKLWDNKMAELRNVLNQSGTAQSMINAIIDGLQGWRNGVDHVYNSHTNVGFARDLQNRMGWKHFFEGRPHKAWRENYTLLQQQSVRGNPGRRWIGALVKKLQDIAWDLWEQRNGILHNKDIGYAAQLADIKIRQLLWQPQIYRIQSIRQLVTHDAEEICTWGLQQKQQWVLRVEAALQHYIRRRGNTQYQQEREGMQRYLRPFQQ